MPEKLGARFVCWEKTPVPIRTCIECIALFPPYLLLRCWRRMFFLVECHLYLRYFSVKPFLRPYMASSGITRRCIAIVADEDQIDEYSNFKAEIEEISNGVVEIEDLEDVQGAEGDNIDDNLRRFLEVRDAILIFCSDAMTNCINYRRQLRLNFDGTIVLLNGEILHGYLQREDLRNKVVLVSMNSNYSVPNILSEVQRTVEGKSVSKAFVNQVIFAVRGIP